MCDRGRGRESKREFIRSNHFVIGNFGRIPNLESTHKCTFIHFRSYVLTTITPKCQLKFDIGFNFGFHFGLHVFVVCMLVYWHTVCIIFFPVSERIYFGWLKVKKITSTESFVRILKYTNVYFACNPTVQCYGIWSFIQHFNLQFSWIFWVFFSFSPPVQFTLP